MTTSNTTTISSIPLTSHWEKQVGPVEESKAASMNRVLLAINAIESLVVLSSGIVESVKEGESYETLTRQLDVLHNNLLEVSLLATSAKISAISSDGI